LGFRAEHTHTRGDQATTGQNINRDYVQLFPSAFFNHKLNDKNELSLSYSRRVDRPTYFQLNPFKILVDNYTYVSGDPYLLPVLSASYQLGYTYNSKYSFTLSHIKSRNAITDVFVQDDATRVSTQIPANMQTYQQYNLTANIPVSVKNVWSSNINAGLYYNQYDSPLQGGQLSNNFLSWDINVSNALTLGKNGWSAELNGFYNSKVAWGQFIIKNLGQVSAGVQKISSNKRSIYKLSAADIFATNHVAVIVQYQNQDWHTNRTWDSRYIAVSYTYKFGKNTVAKSRQRSTGVEDEKRRAG
ncbi:MAG TPA: outer membrane beta-barrel family protein, partial [Niabella sp.]|nr:outer membrane beta-barrel family protein [Niabella sp.]